VSGWEKKKKKIQQQGNFPGGNTSQQFASGSTFSVERKSNPMKCFPANRSSPEATVMRVGDNG